MSELIENRTVLQEVPFANRPVIVKDVNERNGISGIAIAALVVAAMTAAALVTMLIINSQQKTSNEELARERARAVAAQPAPAQPAPQQPLIVNMPQSQPAIVTVPSPASAPSTASRMEPGIAPSNAGLEIEVTSRLQNDEELQRYAVFVMVTHGTATLSGQVPDEGLKKRAERIAGKVTGVRSVINEIVVKP